MAWTRLETESEAPCAICSPGMPERLDLHRTHDLHRTQTQRVFAKDYSSTFYLLLPPGLTSNKPCYYAICMSYVSGLHSQPSRDSNDFSDLLPSMLRAKTPIEGCVGIPRIDMAEPRNGCEYDTLAVSESLMLLSLSATQSLLAPLLPQDWNQPS